MKIEIEVKQPTGASPLLHLPSHSLFQEFDDTENGENAQFFNDGFTGQHLVIRHKTPTETNVYAIHLIELVNAISEKVQNP